MKIAIIDNYDSFTWNLFHYLEPLVSQVDVCRNDEISLEQLSEYNGIVISPGPGMPSDVPFLKEVILKLGPKIPILGVCLGHQAIAEAFGGKLENLPEVWHGMVKKTLIKCDQEVLFKRIPEVFETGHYHSWIVDSKSLPSCFKVTASDEKGNIMAISHSQYGIKGIQFHPESVMTNWGKEIVQNWIKSI